MIIFLYLHRKFLEEFMKYFHMEVKQSIQKRYYLHRISRVLASLLWLLIQATSLTNGYVFNSQMFFFAIVCFFSDNWCFYVAWKCYIGMSDKALKMSNKSIRYLAFDLIVGSFTLHSETFYLYSTTIRSKVRKATWAGHEVATTALQESSESLRFASRLSKEFCPHTL